MVEAGDVRETHHVAVLIGYGASAVNPYLAMESVEQLISTGDVVGVTPQDGVYNLIKGLGKGVLKIMSKMGISTVASYTGAQTFEALGLGQELVDEFFAGTHSQLGGVGLDVIAAEVSARHQMAYPEGGIEQPHRPLLGGGEYQWRRDGEPHLFNPETVFRLQHATRERRYDIFKSYTRGVDDQSENLMTLRGLLKFKNGARPAVPLEEVEPVSSIVKRFSTGAMSYGSISKEAHETLAIAMNRLGGKSNTGEGGEDVDRLLDPERRSAVKQIASGRFGVTSLYLTNADDIQIKMAQGAKPGEGGQLMAQKVYPWVARTRHSTPGVGLISPPPHHDIYSIEDLAQLIYDAKRANPSARVHVKLVSEVGIGTVAAGVTKAKADVVLVSGHDGGTGASPLNSLKHAGVPWELGLAETQQTLMLNGLRDRVVVQVDGQLKTGRDVVIAALLGGEEFGFATAPLVVEGCIMMRVCHLDTCPVGVATQNPELRARFSGKPEFVVNFFEFLAEEVREILAELGFRSIEEAIGHAEMLDTREAINHWKAEGLDLDPILHGLEFDDDAPLRNLTGQNHELDKHFDQRLITMAAEALTDRSPVKIAVDVINTDRSVGTMLGHVVTKTFGTDVLAHGHDRHHADRHRGPVAGRLPARRHHPAHVRRLQRLRGQGPLRRPHHRPPGPHQRVPGREQRDRRQRDRLRRHQRRDVPARPGGRTLPGPQLRRHGGCRRHRRPRLRVHDRRPDADHRPHGPQLRRRHVRRNGLRAGPADHPREQAGAGVRRTPAPRTGRRRPRHCPRPAGQARRGNRIAARRAAARELRRHRCPHYQSPAARLRGSTANPS